jgi:hypothetical protein
MAINNLTPTPRRTRKKRPRKVTLPVHPLVSGLGLDSLPAIRETVDNCAAYLPLLADLVASEGCWSQRCQFALFNQLASMTEVLDAVSGALARLQATGTLANQEGGEP